MADANFSPKTIFSVNKVPFSKTKAHCFVFPALFSTFFSEILVLSTTMGQLCQSLDIHLDLQRTCLVELFVPCVYSDLLVITQTQAIREKEGVIQRILLSLGKSRGGWKWSGVASENKGSAIF